MPRRNSVLTAEDRIANAKIWLMDALSDGPTMDTDDLYELANDVLGLNLTGDFCFDVTIRVFGTGPLNDPMTESAFSEMITVDQDQLCNVSVEEWFITKMEDVDG